MGSRTGSYLPSGKEAEGAQKKAIKNLRWPNARTNLVDADELRDRVTLKGFSTSTHNVDHLEPVAPQTCLGFTCPMRSDECDDCEASKSQEEADTL